jgi:hypothetical protein
VRVCGRSRRGAVWSGDRRVGGQQLNASISFNIVVLKAVEVVWRVN